jgi:phospholipid/cholesterol/gamma-HCH transport system substrate-binding protein
METRANHVWVGVVTLLLLAGLALFFVWLARLGNSDRKEYDIFFEQSVGGLADGSQVSYSGVPVGQVSDIELWKSNPEFVRVRIRVEGDTPILLGTTASISASFTGVSTISLNGGRRGAPSISCETTSCPEDPNVPVIPPQPGGLGEILASAPLLLERLATLTDRLTRLLGDENQESIRGILANTRQISGQLAETTPQVEATLEELQGTLAQSTETLAAFEGTLQSTNRLIDEEGRSLSAELRTTMQTAQSAARALEGTLEDSRPAARMLAETTLPAANATLEDLRRTSASLRAITEKIENQGARALVGGTRLPDYEP